MTDRFPSTTVATAAQQGMVRIHRGAEVRYVWPVHLAGWLSSGWRTGEEQRPPQGVSATQVIPQRPGAEPPLAVPMGTSPAALESPTAEPPAAVVAGPEREPFDAHLPTNLLDFDLEPAPPEAAPQNDPERNDAGSALFAGSEPLADAPAGIEGLVADAASLDAPAESALEEVTAAAAATDPSPEAPQAPDPQQAQAPTRRGRPRKARTELGAQPETQSEPDAQPEAETPEQVPPSASENTGEQQAPTSLLFPSGDDPFGIDPLL